ncbi:cell envelope integrity TolA C-terminal domain-containing protein [Shigella sonnei]
MHRKRGRGEKGTMLRLPGVVILKTMAHQGADISNYAGQIKSAIESKFLMTHRPMQAKPTLRIKLGPDGYATGYQT